MSPKYKCNIPEQHISLAYFKFVFIFIVITFLAPPLKKRVHTFFKFANDKSNVMINR